MNWVRQIAGVLLLLAMAGGPLLAPSAAEAADRFIAHPDGWQTYVNDRFGMRFDYPGGIFAAAPPPENGDGRTFTSGDATLQIFAFHNTGDEDAGSLKARLIGSQGYENVTYSPSGGSWLVLSGFRGDDIFYEKYLFAGGVISAFGMEFPAARKPYYAPIVERIEDSFRAGRSD